MGVSRNLLSSLTLSSRIKAQAYGLGFDLAGIAALGPPRTGEKFAQWVDEGMQGEMGYLDGVGKELRLDATRPHPGATHAIVLAINYGGRAPGGPIARYARGDDYHEVLREKLRELHRWLERETGQSVDARPYVDSGPVLERDLAQRAGLGWFGKNTMLINPQLGSFVFLCSLFVDYPLQPDEPFEADRCGTCTRCIDACPTDAIVEPRVVDARRCISYLTIELKGAIPEELRAPIGALIYGCDICQDVCPYNHKFARELSEPSFAPRASLDGRGTRSLASWLLALSQSEFSGAFRASPMKRAKLRGLKRNSAVALGNVGTADDVPVLVSALADSEPLVRSHAAWALGRIASPSAAAALRARLEVEEDAAVRVELSAALDALASLSR